MTVENVHQFTVHTRHISQILELRTLSRSHATKMEIPTLTEGQMAKFKLLKHWTYGRPEFNLKSVNWIVEIVCIKSVDVCGR